MKKVLFLNLTTFSQTGGIERFNKCFLKALSNLDVQKETDSYSFSAYDEHTSELYYETQRYTGFGKNKLKFVFQSVLHARKYDVVVLGHINLAIAGILIKMLYPSKKLLLVTHGIDVWGQLNKLKLRLLNKADKILAVSNFTRNKILKVHNVPAGKVSVFPNTIDPYFSIPATVLRNDTLRDRYGLKEKDFVIYTLTRLSHTELYKGYDKVITALAEVIAQYPHVKYVIGGKYDEGEKTRIDALINQHNLQGRVILTGFLDEKELVAHYQMADMYIMPSKKEGFGIVFIEAMICGLPVVAGNADGSVDALLNGKTGTLVNPDSKDEIKAAIIELMKSNVRFDEQRLLSIKNETLANYSFSRYQQRLKDIISAC